MPGGSRRRPDPARAGAGGNGKTPGKGPISLRLRDMDVADVFQVLHLLTSQAFIVDEDV